MQAKGISLPSDCPTIFCATRYGNVMASRGSVIPLFLKQIADKKPLTVTDPEMTRFLMSLEESVDLVLYAFRHAKQGDIFVQKSPATTVGELAAALMELVGHKVGIKTIGTRHGEKLYETLISREEMTRTIDMGKFYRIAQDDRDLNYEKYFTSGEEEISKSCDFTSHNTERLSYDQLKSVLQSLEIVRDSCS
jgi:UDP-glucose 4-epimerase